MKLSNGIVGYKLIRDLDDDSYEMIRIVKVKDNIKLPRDKRDKCIAVYNYADENTYFVSFEDLSNYSALEPDGVLTASIATVNDNDTVNKDVIVTASKFIDIKIGKLPYVICRQSVTDLFYNILTNSENNNMVGLSCNQDTCPAGFDFRMLLSANNIIDHKIVYFYRNDTFEDILELINTLKFDNVLYDLYNRHCKNSNNPNAIMKNEDMGWCKNLKTLLLSNGFDTDLNQMLGISKVEFDIGQYIIEKELPNKEKYESLSEDLIAWLSVTYDINITDITILKYDHDIDLAEYKNTKYLLFKDITDTLYFIIYNENGERFQADLEALEKEYDFSTKFKLNYINKYSNIDTINSAIKI